VYTIPNPHVGLESYPIRRLLAGINPDWVQESLVNW
jgi:hypothetical protein